MNNLDNLEKVSNYLEKAIGYLTAIEHNLEEGTITEDQENEILTAKDTLEEERIRSIEFPGLSF